MSYEIVRSIKLNRNDNKIMGLLDFNDKPFSAQLGHLFLNHNWLDEKAIFDYISVGQYYWIFKEGERIKVRVTHKYGGVIFYVTEDSDIDCHFDGLNAEDINRLWWNSERDFDAYQRDSYLIEQVCIKSLLSTFVGALGI